MNELTSCDQLISSYNRYITAGQQTAWNAYRVLWDASLASISDFISDPQTNVLYNDRQQALRDLTAMLSYQGIKAAELFPAQYLLLNAGVSTNQHYSLGAVMPLPLCSNHFVCPVIAGELSAVKDDSGTRVHLYPGLGLRVRQVSAYAGAALHFEQFFWNLNVLYTSPVIPLAIGCFYGNNTGFGLFVGFKCIY